MSNPRAFRFLTKKGKIVSFSPKTATGKVRVGQSRYSFEVTSFRSQRGSRFPESGEEVDAVLSEDGSRLVSLWSAKGPNSRR